MHTGSIIVLSLLALAIVIPQLRNAEPFTASAVQSDYPRLIYNVRPYLPTGTDFFVNYDSPSYKVPTSLPPHLAQGSFYAPKYY